MTASVPSSTAFATSVASARVGSGLDTIERSIWVAVMTGLPARLALAISSFCTIGTRSIGISPPRTHRGRQRERHDVARLAAHRRREPKLRTPEVLQDRDRPVSREPADQRDACAVLGVGAVREVQPEDVDPCLDQPADRLSGRGGGAECCNDPGTRHAARPLLMDLAKRSNDENTLTLRAFPGYRQRSRVPHAD